MTICKVEYKNIQYTFKDIEKASKALLHAHCGNVKELLYFSVFAFDTVTNKVIKQVQGE